ncbi:hypothetical protein KCP77_05105 [Salmonella enterica subsp. enterica]|nr:hypothetical protein KCP77_05105 [Salmonella enterica subsp. enterica]
MSLTDGFRPSSPASASQRAPQTPLLQQSAPAISAELKSTIPLPAAGSGARSLREPARRRQPVGPLRKTNNVEGRQKQHAAQRAGVNRAGNARKLPLISAISRFLRSPKHSAVPTPDQQSSRRAAVLIPTQRAWRRACGETATQSANRAAASYCAVGPAP